LEWWRSFGSNFEEKNKKFSATINFYKISVLAGTERRLDKSQSRFWQKMGGIWVV
jgi:hypothetical protein